jgi:hypothetical protein
MIRGRETEIVREREIKYGRYDSGAILTIKNIKYY